MYKIIKSAKGIGDTTYFVIPEEKLYTINQGYSELLDALSWILFGKYYDYHQIESGLGEDADWAIEEDDQVQELLRCLEWKDVLMPDQETIDKLADQWAREISKIGFKPNPEIDEMSYGGYVFPEVESILNGSIKENEYSEIIKKIKGE